MLQGEERQFDGAPRRSEATHRPRYGVSSAGPLSSSTAGGVYSKAGDG